MENLLKKLSFYQSLELKILLQFMRLNGLFILLLHYSLCSLISISKAFNSFGMNFFLQSGRPNIGPILALPFPPCKVISEWNYLGQKSQVLAAKRKRSCICFDLKKKKTPLKSETLNTAFSIRHVRVLWKSFTRQDPVRAMPPSTPPKEVLCLLMLTVLGNWLQSGIYNLKDACLKFVPVFKNKAICSPSLFRWMQAV